MPFYAVHKGFKVGVYKSWDDCEFNIIGHSGAKYKKFDNRADAELFVKTGISQDSVSDTDFKISLGSRTKPKAPLVNVNIENAINTNDINIYTDGSYFKRGGKTCCGYGIYIPSRNISKSFNLSSNMTSNRAELLAIITAISLFNKDDKLKLNIYTDSKYCTLIFGATGIKYRNNKYKTDKGEDVKNKDLVQKVMNLRDNYIINMYHVRSHTKKTDEHSLGNDKADNLATTGAMQTQN